MSPDRFRTFRRGLSLHTGAASRWGDRLQPAGQVLGNLQDLLHQRRPVGTTTAKALGHHAQQVGHGVPAGAFPVLEGEDPAVAFQQGLACSLQQLQTFLNGA